MMSLNIGTLSETESDLVLTKVFERMRPVDLEKVQLVSKKWYQLSLPIWRRTGTASIWQDGVTFNMPRIISVSKLVKGLEDPEDKLKLISDPFVSYKLTSWTISQSCCEDLSQFWKLVGPLIKSIDFEICHFHMPPRNTPHVFRKLLEHMPNLEHLTFSDSRFHGADHRLANIEPGEDYDAKEEKGYRADVLQYGDDSTELLISRVFPLKTEEDQEKLPTYLKLKSLKVDPKVKLPFYWKDFLGMFPKLERIRVGEGHPVKDVGSIIEAISAIRKENPEALQNLKIMEVEGLPLKRKDIDLLKDLKLPVKSLGIPYLQDDKSTDCFMDELFASYAGALDTLIVRRAKWTSWKKLEYLVFTSPLGNLTRLQLEGIVVEDMEFLKKTPNLRVLEIKQRFWEKCYPFENWKRNDDLVELTDLDEDFTLKSMAELRIHGDVKATSFNTLKKWMPNLMSMEMDFTNESLWETYRLWPELEEIVLMDWNNVGEDGILGKRSRGQSSSNLGNSPNITDLKYLRSFAVRADNVAALTDASVYKGLMKLERLTRFIVSTPSEIPASDETLKALKEKVFNFFVFSRARLLDYTVIRTMRN